MTTHTSTTSTTAKVFLVLAIIGALNWGLIGFFNFNLVDAIFGGGAVERTSSFSRVIYALVGIAGVVGLLLLPKLHGDEPRRRVTSPPYTA